VVISGRREAELSFLGATQGLPPGAVAPLLVFDIGGGSTEFISGAPDAPGPAVSVDLGCVRMTERHQDPHGPGLDPGVSADIARLVAEAGSVVPLAGAGTVVGLSGTVTTIAALAMGLKSYDPALVHHARIGTAQAHQLAVELAAMDHDQRAALPAMHPGRVDVIVAGAMILDQVLAATGATELLVSEHDILDGLVWAG
jgi:exopolyphosphatase / guanosine-5'-triphosphate,3'-diphosphate pyrophosphatase